MEKDLDSFVLSKLCSLLGWERTRAETAARQALIGLHQSGEIDLAECLIEAMRGKEEELLFQFPEIAERFKDWWEWEQEANHDDYKWDNRRDRPASGTSVRHLG